MLRPAPTRSSALPRRRDRWRWPIRSSSSKTDLAPLGPDLARRLDRINARAPRIIAAAAGDPGAVLFETARAAAPMLPSGEPAAAHTHGIDAFAISLGSETDPARLRPRVWARPRPRQRSLTEFKGIVCFADRPEGPAVVQAAQHAMFAPEWLDHWPKDWPPDPAGQDRRSRLVFVVHQVPRAEILAHFAFADARLWGAPGE